MGREVRDGVANLFNPVPNNPKSHVRGWAMHWAEILKTGITRDPRELEIVFFDHGVNSEPGKLNLFGGVSDGVARELREVVERDVAIVSLDHEPHAEQYCQGLRKRLGQKSCSRHLTEDVIDEFEVRLREAPRVVMEDHIGHDGLMAIGDSHTTSYAPTSCPVIRQNGLTLHGALRDGWFEKHVARLVGKGLKHVTLVAGSIDVRHHLCRQEDPFSAAAELIRDWANAAAVMEDEHGITVMLSAPVPVEHEERRIPKTGWHKDRPFSGSQELRAQVTDFMRDCLVEFWPQQYVAPPNAWYEMDPEEYAKTHMELSSSVHIAPTSYRKRGGWS